MIWGNGSAAAMAAADAAKAAVRSTANFNWTFIALLALVVCAVYVPQIKKKNWNGVFAALALQAGFRVKDLEDVLREGIPV